MQTNEIFAIKLKELRENAKLSQEDLGKALGCSRGSISYYEQKQRVPDIAFLAAVSKYFTVSADFLLGLSDTRSPDDVEMLGLKPCPFCGEVPDTVITGLIAYPAPLGEFRPRNIAVKVTCNNCKISFANEIEADEGFFSYSFANVFQAVCETEELWNKRSDA